VRRARRHAIDLGPTRDTGRSSRCQEARVKRGGARAASGRLPRTADSPLGALGRPQAADMHRDLALR